jgi:glycosyltransferase involved in cell wall biosynthesis
MDDRFHFVGYQEDVPSWLEAIDVLIMPSYSEASPIVVVEAMSVGLPVVSTRVGDVPFMLEEIDVPLVEPGDVSGLIAGTERMLGLTSEERKALGRLLKQRAYARYSLDIVATLHLEIYQNALRSGGFRAHV